ncbi:MAG: DivIVA domain-containing protein [Mycobacteriaceae bacterium]
MRLTPADVHNVAFSKPPIGKRGYNEDEVDAFLDLVEAELARLVEENNDLRQRVQELDDQVAQAQHAGSGAQEGVLGSAEVVSTPTSGTVAEARDGEVHDDEVHDGASDGAASTPSATETATGGQSGRTSTPAPTASGQDVGDHNLRAAKVLALAQEMADRLTGEARGEAEAVTTSAKSSADTLLGDATFRSEKMLADATAKSEKLTSDARAKSDAQLADARTRAETLQRQAKEKADALTAEAERKHTEVVGSMNTQRTELEGKIEELRTFEREYRTRLKSYLESQLQELGQRGSAAPAEAARTGPGPSPAAGGFSSSFGSKSERNG